MEDNKQKKKEYYANLTTKELEVLAEQGDAEAQFNLGLCYYNGTGIEQDYKKTVKWFLKAAK